MSTVAVPKTLMTEAEYLALERRSDEKHEFYQGEIFSMAGDSREHNLIALNLGGELRQELKDRPCEAYVGDMRVRITRSGLYTYPDVVAICGEPEFLDAEVDTLLNPTVLIEVLSDSTEEYDRGTKLKHYRKIPSLREYILVSQLEPLVEQFVRRDNNHWDLSETAGLETTLRLSSIGCDIPLAEIYDK
ncbi:MAG TPA: Uma2 family endonuclease, partial [Planctomycetaceae bacterium]|nr:Uma2 family endonuclease [Planctomycetaceae bacterium]